MSSLPEAVQVGEWRVEPELDRVSRGDEALKLEPRAMRVLLHLVARAGHVVSVSELLEAAWPDVVVGSASVYQAIALLRRTLGDDRIHPSYIAHVPRKGYRLVAPVGPAAAPPPPATATPAPGAKPLRHRYARAGRWALLTLLLCGALAGLLTLRARLPVAAPALASAGHPPPVSAASIAVLPFLDLSEKHDLGYFADGLSEELIDRLSRGSQLRVPARTSSFYFKDRPTPLSEIAAALAVDHLLEGSVRRSGARVRVTVQLIRAADGYHLWSQSYDRDFTEILNVEDDIAGAVAGSLQATLSASRLAAAAFGMSGAARNLLLQCQFFVRRNTPADADKAVGCFRELLTLAPRAAPAWAGYADALLRQPLLHDVPLGELRSATAAARQAAEHAIALAPAFAPPHATLASYHRLVEHDWAAARADLDAALAADPDDPATLLSAANLARTLGHFTEAIELCQHAQARDPLNFQSYARLGTLYLYQGRLADAEAAVRRRIDLAPEGSGGHTQLVDVLLARGEGQLALAAAEQETDEESRLVALALAYQGLGRRAEADAALKALQLKYGARFPAEIADIYAFRGDRERAFALLEAARSAGDPAVFDIGSDSYLKPLSGDARYQSLLRRLGLPGAPPV